MAIARDHHAHEQPASLCRSGRDIDATILSSGSGGADARPNPHSRCQKIAELSMGASTDSTLTEISRADAAYVPKQPLLTLTLPLPSRTLRALFMAEPKENQLM